MNVFVTENEIQSFSKGYSDLRYVRFTFFTEVILNLIARFNTVKINMNPDFEKILVQKH